MNIRNYDDYYNYLSKFIKENLFLKNNSYYLNNLPKESYTNFIEENFLLKTYEICGKIRLRQVFFTNYFKKCY